MDKVEVLEQPYNVTNDHAGVREIHTMESHQQGNQSVVATPKLSKAEELVAAYLASISGEVGRRAEGGGGGRGGNRGGREDGSRFSRWRIPPRKPKKESKRKPRRGQRSRRSAWGSARMYSATTAGIGFF